MLRGAPLRKPVALPLPLPLPVSVPLTLSFALSVSVFVAVFVVSGLRGNLDWPRPLVVNLYRRHIRWRTDSLLSDRLSERRGVAWTNRGGLKCRGMGISDVEGASRSGRRVVPSLNV